MDFNTFTWFLELSESILQRFAIIVLRKYPAEFHIAIRIIEQIQIDS